MSAGKEITARLGDTLRAIAAREGVPPDVVWGHEKNKGIRDRGHPDLVYPGDVVFVPLPAEKTVQGQTGGVVAATMTVPPVPLKLRIHVNGVPAEGVACVPSFAPEEEKKTEKGGKLELELPGGVGTFTLRVVLPPPEKQDGEEKDPPPYLAPRRELTFLVGHLENDVALLQARLTNLGFHCGRIDGKLGKRTRGALRRFQKAFGLERNGDPSHRATQDELRQLHQDGLDRKLTDEDTLCRSADPPHHVLTGDAWNSIVVVDGPEVIVDAHMHVNSGKCSPMPLIWDKFPKVKALGIEPRPSRKQVRELLVPGLNLAKQGLSAVQRAAELGRQLDVGVARLTEAELVGLTTVVAKTVIASGYVVTEAAQQTTSSVVHGAAGLVDATGRVWQLGATIDRGAGRAAGELEQRLRAMVPDEAEQSAEVMRNATGFAGRLLAAVHGVYRSVSRKVAEGRRRLANGVTETAANVAGAASRHLLSAADEEEELARIRQAAARDLHRIASDTNRSFDLVQADAKRMVDFVASVVKARVRRGADRAVDAIDTVRSRTVESWVGLPGNMAGFTALSEKDTLAISGLAAKGNGDAMAKIPSATIGGRLSMMMVMPMDMDFGHIAGYYGQQIYHPVETRLAEDVRVQSVGGIVATQTMTRRPLPPGSTERVGRRPTERVFVPSSDPGVPPIELVVDRTVVREEGPFYHYAEYREDERRFKDSRLVKEARWLPEDEFKAFEAYPKQVLDTLAGAARYPWTLLPLFHYDPRRWNAGPTTVPSKKRVGDREFESFPQRWDAPFRAYFSSKDNRPFIGIKQYTALGYRPLDPRLEHQHDFYRRCTDATDPIPIVCHCSPAGQYSLERPLYVREQVAKECGERVKERDPVTVNKAALAAYEKTTKALIEQRGLGSDDWDEYWFSEHYVSPFAWREVLKRYPSLRLALAHFGGDEAPAYTHWAKKFPSPVDPGLLDRPWSAPLSWDDAIVKLCKEYENFHVDISFFILDGMRRNRFEDMLEKFPHMLDKILFGTDWWMTENSGLSYTKYIAKAKEALDRIDPELWQRFSWINPVRFYRLKENAEGLAGALRAAAPVDRELKRAHDEAVEDGLRLLNALAPGAIHGR